MNQFDKAETGSKLPTASGHLPSYQQLLDIAIDLSFPASDPPAVSACGRCADEPLFSAEKKADQSPKGAAAQQQGAGKKAPVGRAEEVDWALKTECV